MKYNFKQSVHIAGKDFPRGVQEVSEKVENDPQFLKYVGCGFVTEYDQPIASLESQKERGDRLLDKLMKKQEARRAKSEMKEPESLAPSPSPDGDASSDEDKPKSKGGKNKAR